MSVWRVLAVLCAATLPQIVVAADAAPDAPARERERIRVERDATERRFQAALTACGDRFAVTACTDAARAERRAAMERLSRQQGVLADAERKDRAAQRLRRIEDKMREVDQRRETAAPTRPAAAARPAPQRHITRAPAPAHRASEATDHEAAARAVAAQRRASEAQAHREAVEKRNAERAAKKPTAMGLPVPPPASKSQP